MMEVEQGREGMEWMGKECEKVGLAEYLDG